MSRGSRIAYNKVSISIPKLQKVSSRYHTQSLWQTSKAKDQHHPRYESFVCLRKSGKRMMN